MKILIICSKKFYDKIPVIKEFLEGRTHTIYLPNCYDNPGEEQKAWNQGAYEHQLFKEQMYKQSAEAIAQMDAVLVLNYDKQTENGLVQNYVGGATFLEMYEAFKMGKKIYMMNDIPEGILYDEIQGFNPTIINNNLELVL